MKKLFLNNQGLSLLEMIIAIFLFSVVVLVVTDLSLSIIQEQRRSIALQNVQENMRYVFEVTSKEIRHAQRSDAECYGSATTRMYNTNPAKTILYFKNKNDECVSYALVDGSLIVRRGPRVATATPPELLIDNLSFDVRDNNIDGSTNPKVQPRVTFKMKAEMRGIAVDLKNVFMETTITSRFYE